MMKLKTYRAPTMADALAAVKKDLGRNAVILHTRNVKSGGLLSFRRKTLIEITASDESPKVTRRPQNLKPPAPDLTPSSPPPSLAPLATQAYRKAAQAGRTAGTGLAAGGEPESATSAAKPPLSTPDLRRLNPPAPEPVVMSVRQRKLAPGEIDPPGLPLKPGDKAAPVSLAPVTPASAASIHRELADIKLLVSQVLSASPASPNAVAAGAMPEALFRHYLSLLEAAVSREIAEGIIGSVRDELTPGELSDESIVRNTVLRHLAGLIPVADAVLRPGAAPVGRALAIALVGPTGVGKTTTIAKLAAAYKLRHGKSVALITSDTYRIAAVDQLRTYAGIIGLPIRVVMTAAEMESAVHEFSEYDVVLIDSAGRSQNATERLSELADLLAAAAPHEIHLVLSATASEEVLVRTAQAFSVVKPNRVILTKLDETVNFGVVVNIAHRLCAAFSFVTTGQDDPDQIEAGRPDRLSRMILDNTLAPAGQNARAASGGGSPGSRGIDAERSELLEARAAV